MSYDVCVVKDGEETWIDYGFLKNGCTDEIYFNWMYSLWTATNPDIRDMHVNGILRKFISCGYEGCEDNKDNKSHYKKFHCVKETDWLWNQIDHKAYKVMLPDKIDWVTSPKAELSDWSKVDRNKLFWNVYGSGPKFTNVYKDDYEMEGY